MCNKKLLNKMEMGYNELLGFKNNDTKRVNMILYEIWNKITGKEWEPCFCNKEERLKFNKHFFEWLEDNKHLV
jgi:hypothetical protein